MTLLKIDCIIYESAGNELADEDIENWTGKNKTQRQLSLRNKKELNRLRDCLKGIRKSNQKRSIGKTLI